MSMAKDAAVQALRKAREGGLDDLQTIDAILGSISAAVITDHQDRVLGQIATISYNMATSPGSWNSTPEEAFSRIEGMAQDLRGRQSMIASPDTSTNPTR